MLRDTSEAEAQAEADVGVFPSPGGEQAVFHDFSTAAAGPPRLKDSYKRVFDPVFVAALHLVLFPFFLVLWTAAPLAIRLESRGPVFYRQQRVGRDGEVFELIKFRTMFDEADSEAPRMLLTRQGDPRVTRVGRFLRRFHLDEFPQVLNVVKGEMSLVGPRPKRTEIVKQHEKEAPGFSTRQRALPGITGLAQLRGNYDCGAKQVLRYDNLYIDSLNPLLDLKLLLITPFVVLARRNR